MTGPNSRSPAAGSADVPAWLRRLAGVAAEMDVPRVVRPPASGGRRSAVLVLFGAGPDGPDLLYIQKNEGLRRHAGQPAFPGGKIEDNDDGPVAAALREAAEETGLDPAGVDVIGMLPELFVAASQFRVVPVLAWWRVPSAVRPVDIGEIAAVERISVAVRHYFGHFEEGEEGGPEAAEAPEGEAAESAAADTENLATGELEVETPEAVAGTAEAELENASEVLEEAEMERSAQAETEELATASEENEALAEADAEDESLTAAELAIENVPPADEEESGSKQ